MVPAFLLCAAASLLLGPLRWRDRLCFWNFSPVTEWRRHGNRDPMALPCTAVLAGPSQIPSATVPEGACDSSRRCSEARAEPPDHHPKTCHRPGGEAEINGYASEFPVSSPAPPGRRWVRGWRFPVVPLTLHHRLLSAVPPGQAAGTNQRGPRQALNFPGHRRSGDLLPYVPLGTAILAVRFRTFPQPPLFRRPVSERSPHRHSGNDCPRCGPGGTTR